MFTPSVRRAARVVAQLATATSLVAVLASAASAQTPVTKDQPAQPPAGGGRGGNRMMAMMMDSLSLTADQRKKVDSINEAFTAKMPPMQQGTPPTDEERQARQKLMADRTAAIKAVLTAEQATKYDALMASMRGGGRPRP